MKVNTHARRIRTKKLAVIIGILSVTLSFIRLWICLDVDCLFVRFHTLGKEKFPCIFFPCTFHVILSYCI